MVKREAHDSEHPSTNEHSTVLSAGELYSTLLDTYGKPRWWSENPCQVMTEAVLVQHTTCNSVKKLRPALEDKLSPACIQALPQEELEQLIRPCGFQKAKARTIKAIAGWFLQYGGDAGAVRALPLERLRTELLALRGIGAETADVILVYAFRLPSFIVDAYTRTFLTRLGYRFADDMAIRRFFEQGLGRDAELYGSVHWLILKHCIARCKKKPLCKDCPFAWRCPEQAD